MKTRRGAQTAIKQEKETVVSATNPKKRKLEEFKKNIHESEEEEKALPKQNIAKKRKTNQENIKLEDKVANSKGNKADEKKEKNKRNKSVLKETKNQDSVKPKKSKAKTKSGGRRPSKKYKSESEDESEAE